MRPIVIVGAGPAGLYTAWRLLQVYPGDGLRIDIYEKTDRVGGRTNMGCAAGHWVTAGAGIVRRRDRILRRLCRHLGIPLRRFTTRIRWDGLRLVPKDPVAFVESCLRDMMDRREDLRRSETFRENMVRLYGEPVYRRFVHCVGATDFENADVIDTLYDFGFQDNLPNQTMYAVDWDALMGALALEVTRSGRCTIHLATPVLRAERGAVWVPQKHRAAAVIWTAPRPSWSSIHPEQEDGGRRTAAAWDSLLDQVRCQPFLRAYALPASSSDAARAEHRFPTTTYLPLRNPLQKIIPVRAAPACPAEINNHHSAPDRIIYMISYADNEHAVSTNEHLRGRDRDRFLEACTRGVRWDTRSMRVFFHRCGTQYFRPLEYFRTRTAMLRYGNHPCKWLYMCGEGLSRNQGWTEGALESVERMLRGR